MAYLTNSFDPVIAKSLQQGRVGFMPSDTVYGLSCAALNQVAVHRLQRLKNRDEHKPFIVLVSDIKMLDMLSIDKSQIRKAKNYWPGALTFVCQAELAPPWLQHKGGTVAVRIPDNSKLRDLISQTGPIVSTSANQQGRHHVDSAQQAIDIFGEDLDFYVDVGEIHSQPSTIVRFNNGRLEVLRQGAVKIDSEEE